MGWSSFLWGRRWDYKSHWGLEIQPATIFMGIKPTVDQQWTFFLPWYLDAKSEQKQGRVPLNVENHLNHGIFRGNWKENWEAFHTRVTPYFLSTFPNVTIDEIYGDMIYEYGPYGGKAWRWKQWWSASGWGLWPLANWKATHVRQQKRIHHPQIYHFDGWCKPWTCGWFMTLLC